MEHKIFIGIDPSINSTGVCVRIYDDQQLQDTKYYIVKPNKLTKKEKLANESLLCFDYILYKNIDLREYKDNNHLHEYWKTINMINAVESIKTIILSIIQNYPIYDIYIVQEGISYGSTLRTKSVFDLAGLNYMIRQLLSKLDVMDYTIATPSEIKKYATGNGNCKKEVMINLFTSIHKELTIIPKIDDISDAYFMAEYAHYMYTNENE